MNDEKVIITSRCSSIHIKVTVANETSLIKRLQLHHMAFLFAEL